MSRNKIILLVGALILIYISLPSEGIYLKIKMIMLTVAPYIMIGIIIYLIITIQILKKSLYKLSQNVSDENIYSVVKLLKISFDVKRMVGTVNLINMYNLSNKNKNVSYEAKNAFYEALRKKHIEIAPPSGVPKGGR